MISQVSSGFRMPTFSLVSRVGSGSALEEPTASKGSSRSALRELASQLASLRRSLERLQTTARVTTSAKGVSVLAAASSSAAIGLTVEASFSTLKSTEEVNAVSTSFTPRAPALGPESTAVPTLSGTYDGAQGDDTLTVKIKDDGAIGDDRNLQVELGDSQDNKISELNFKGLAPDTPLTFSNGIQLAFSAGSLTKNETFDIQVSSSVGSVADPDRPFNGTGDTDPVLEEALPVTAGSFKVNGATINVLADDTIHTVLDKINASVAGVTASFEAATERVILTQNSSGPTNTITVSEDTSGFLASMKLADATPSIPEFTRVISGEEINTATTSFTPFGPSFDQQPAQSTALPTVGGVYSAEQGDDTFTFKIKDNGAIGEDSDLKVELRDGQGDKIEEVEFRNLAAGTEVAFSNGLTLSFSAGSIEKDETFQIQVFQNVPSSVDPDKPFNGTRNANPGFDQGIGVSAGSFDVNGVTIDVLDTDTINTVIGKINALVPDVTASFDAQSEKIQIAHGIPGSFNPVTLENDTSGFITATKLNVTPEAGGQGHDANRLISTVPSLAGISTGDFEINGVSISVDIAVDTLDDVIARINSSDANVTATLNAGADTLTIRTHSAMQNLVLSDGTSGFLSALNITPGTIQSGRGSGQTASRFTLPKESSLSMRDVAKELNGFFKNQFSDVDAEALDAIRGELRDVISGSFKDLVKDTSSSRLRSGFGISFDFCGPAREVFEYDLTRFRQAAKGDFAQLHDFLFQPGSSARTDGLVPGLIDSLKSIQGAVADALTSREKTGLLVDLQA